MPTHITPPSSSSAAVDAIEAAGSAFVANTLAQLGLHGDGVTDDLPRITALANEYAGYGLPLVLPKATYLCNQQQSGTAITFNDGVKIKGNGCTFKLTNPTPTLSRFVFKFAGTSDHLLEDITFDWPAGETTTSTANTCGLWHFSNVDGLVLRRVKMFAPGAIQTHWHSAVQLIEMLGCDNVVMEDCEFRYAQWTWGVHVVGGTNHSYTRCEFSDNGSDGLKIANDGTYGDPTNFTITDCRLNRNGQVVMQGGQDTGTSAAIDPADVITDANVASSASFLASRYGKRILINLTTPANLYLPATTASTQRFLFSKRIGSATPTIRPQAGETLNNVVDNSKAWSGGAYATSGFHDRTLFNLTEDATGWDYDDLGNGEGADISGTNLHFVNCIAEGNEGGGLQVKPTNTGGERRSCHITFTNCCSNDTWNSNGFAVVNAANATGLLPPQHITYTNCSASGNRASGWSFQAIWPITGVVMSNCIARNNGVGIYLHAGCRDFSFSNIQLIGNGKGSSPANSWNMIMPAGQGHRFSNITMLGTDPQQQLDYSITEMDAATPLCEGLLLYRQFGAGAENTMDDVVIRGFRAARHHSADVVYKENDGSTTTVLSAADFDSTNAPGVCYFVEDETP